jgi:hypothetical protein
MQFRNLLMHRPYTFRKPAQAGMSSDDFLIT